MATRSVDIRFSLFPPEPRDRPIHAVRQLLIGELVAVIDRSFQPRQLGLERRGQRRLARLAVEVMQLVQDP